MRDIIWHMAQQKSTVSSGTSALTPMMAQYQTIKEKYQDILLFYRMGDFYEMFFHDAEMAASALGIALTHRGKQDGKDIPMCGVPVHAMDSYLPRLIKQGFRVAVCEQSETPESFKQKGGKGPLPRQVVRVITPGTIQEDELLQPDQHNILAAIGRVGGAYSLCWTDMSTGSLSVQHVEPDQLENMLARLAIAELVFPEDCHEMISPLSDLYAVVSAPATSFDSQKSAQHIQSFFKIASLDGLGTFTPPMVSALGGLLSYLKTTQLEQMPRLSLPQIVGASSVVEIDAATRRSLEITQTLSGEKKGSLLHAIDRTSSAAGARLLFTRLSTPLTDRTRIDNRLDLADWFYQHDRPAQICAGHLSQLSDIERALSRLVASRGGPRDLAGLAQSLLLARQIFVSLSETDASSDAGLSLDVEGEEAGKRTRLLEIAQRAAAPARLADEILPALADELPLLVRDGQFIRQGYRDDLDHLRQLKDESRRLIASLQANYCDQTQIASLKIKHNNVLGYHIDVRAGHADKLMSNPEFIHRQTTAQTVRFTTTELAELEKQLSTAAEQSLELELEIFETLRSLILKHADEIITAASALARLDVAISTAMLARNQNFTRPHLYEDTRLAICGGRHCVVEQMLSADQQFVTNDCRLDGDANIWLLTGPNMAGKSTFLRQNAHLVILAQAGLYVPAQTAEIGIADRIFSRVGASDDLARGQSTFMVEMVETAAILNQSTERSIVILDEIGRGTATWDGLAIAWSCLEYLHNKIGCRTLFATHYHELTALESQLATVACYSMQVREWKQDIVFLHKVIAGSADKSYGVHVARLAGLPQQVTRRAAQLVTQLEEHAKSQNSVQDSLPLFAQYDPGPHDTAAPSPYYPPNGSDDDDRISELEAKMADIEPDSLSPRAALELIYELKQLVDK